MIENLLVSGCSFTAGKISWPNIVRDKKNIPNLFNLGSYASGNRYIANSIIDTIQHYKLTPQNTLVIVMWSGADRFDELVSGEYWHLLSDYTWKTKLGCNEDAYWIHSGGRSNSWFDHSETIKLFQQKYIVSDPLTMCKDTLRNILCLENFLQNQGFDYRFMSYINCWVSDRESVGQGDFSITNFCANLPAYQAINFDNWIFTNREKDGLWEFCLSNNWLAPDGSHPNETAHRTFVEQIILPQLDLIKGKV